MPKLRANPSLTGGQIRLRSSARGADLKWLGVFAVMLAATAFEGLPMAQFGRAAIEVVSRGGSTVAVASEARVIDRPAEQLTRVARVDRADNDIADGAISHAAARDTAAAAGLFGRPSVKVQFCRWLKSGSNS